MKRRRARIEDFTVGWICALHIELTAAKEGLDEEYERLDDAAQYTLGRVGKHDIVVACLPAGRMGTNSAAAVAVQMQSTFPSLQYGLMVGIAGGVPSPSADIRLGDVVISHPQGRYGGVVQYDFGKTGLDGERVPHGSLNSPHANLLQAVAAMRSSVNAGRSKIPLYISAMEARDMFSRPEFAVDNLYDAAYNHVEGVACDGCQKERTLQRVPRSGQDILIHYGTVASGNQVIKDGLTRDRISAAYGGVLCFEMEAAGLMNIFPCLVIRGICDYADSHKNKGWQPFAAAAAAASAKEILSFVPTASWVFGRKSLAKPAVMSREVSSSQLENPKLNEVEGLNVYPGPVEHDMYEPSSLYAKSNLTREVLETYHQSLRFGEMDARHATIRDAHSKTCSWILQKSEYHDWLASDKISEHYGFFWIKGNPGTGKSTIMKFLIASTKRAFPQTLVTKFFFNARGSTLERTVVGMYRSLLFQLLDKHSFLQSVFALLRPGKTAVALEAYVWTLETVQDLFGHAVLRLGQHSLICFIDALDECEEEDVREMIAFFEHLGDVAVSSGLSFRICLSSRHYPHITINHSISLTLENQEGHGDDVAHYVNAKLRGVRSPLVKAVKTEICARSFGIFLWVVLVVQILQRDFDRGQLQAVRNRLKEIPDGLNKLFDDILKRKINITESTILSLQWILFAKRPLHPVELFYAVILGTDPNSVADLDPDDLDQGSLANFVLDSSKRLAEVTRCATDPQSENPDQDRIANSDMQSFVGLTETQIRRSGTVQFIHESVREYLLSANGLPRLRADLTLNCAGASHERLKKSCQYLIELGISQREQLAATSKVEALGALKRNYPLLEYAVRSILFHVDAAAECGIKQQDFVERFPSLKWMALANCISATSDVWAVGSSGFYYYHPSHTHNLLEVLNLREFEVGKWSHIEMNWGD